MHPTTAAVPFGTTADLIRAGLLNVSEGCRIHPTAVFLPEDVLGTPRPITLGARTSVGAFAVIHGGTRTADDVHVGHQAIVGEPEHGYAIRAVHPGAGGPTTIGPGAVLRAGAIIYAGVHIGPGSMIGHRVLLRTAVTVGADSQLAANLTVERGTTIGAGVRCSPGSHLTADTIVGDRVFLGAGVRTINDKRLIWRDPDHEQPLAPPVFQNGCKIGSGAVVLAGVTVGAHALVGAGSIVTRDVSPDTIVYGVPARPHGAVNR